MPDFHKALVTDLEAVVLKALVLLQKEDSGPKYIYSGPAFKVIATKTETGIVIQIEGKDSGRQVKTG